MKVALVLALLWASPLNAQAVSEPNLPSAVLVVAGKSAVENDQTYSSTVAGSAGVAVVAGGSLALGNPQIRMRGEGGAGILVAGGVLTLVGGSIRSSGRGTALTLGSTVTATGTAVVSTSAEAASETSFIHGRCPP